LLVLVAPTRADDARVEVARLDGAPVYHWRVFLSHYGDDVDRALILREFDRGGYHLPQHYLDQALAEEVAGHYGGDEKRLTEKLRQAGVTLQDYKAFIGEEMILAAMIAREAKRTKEFFARTLARSTKETREDRTTAMSRLGLRPNQTMKLTATAVRFGETFLVTYLSSLRFALCVSGGSSAFSR
jgi:uncharacterized protein YbjQ (UPF0145 family)